MTGNAPSVIDRTVHETNEWLNELAEAIGGSKQDGYHALRAGLHALRDRMVADEAVHLGQQLPLLIRGIYFEDWKPSATPHKQRSREAYLDFVRQKLSQDGSSIEPETALDGVFTVLKMHIDKGELGHVADQLPGEVTEMMRVA
ncbi:MAG: DUF2267 domain-containing protein [Rhodosalinus sp.]|uniref:DUF2267 domain-containing protein n=1 Tax=Rhodosalinus sp. TaxID=2047741 RepID=UPI00397C0B82